MFVWLITMPSLFSRHVTSLNHMLTFNRALFLRLLLRHESDDVIIFMGYKVLPVVIKLTLGGPTVSLW